ncbi:MAG: potassium-transporting ATPase subunit C [Clostridia bacterium]
MKALMNTLKPALVALLVMTILCGILYTAAVTGVAQLLFQSKADGSRIMIDQADGTAKEYGSELIGQSFTQPQYLIGRPMGVSNLSPVCEEQRTLVAERVDWWHALDPNNTSEIPMELVTTSGSGVDPYLSPEAAAYQVSRIARERKMDEETVRALITTYTTGRFLGVLGEPVVHVLKVNLALDGLL